MRNWIWALAITLLIALLAPAPFAQPPQQGKSSEPPPPWAYGFATPPKPGGEAPPPAAGGAAPPDNVTQKHVEGS